MYQYHAAVAGCLQHLTFLADCLDLWRAHQHDAKLRPAAETGITEAVQGLMKSLSEAEQSKTPDYRSDRPIKFCGADAGISAHDAIVKLAQRTRLYILTTIGSVDDTASPPRVNIDGLERLDMLAAVAKLDGQELRDAAAWAWIELGNDAPDEARCSQAAMTNEERALGYLAAHPETASLAELADALGVDRGTPYRWPRFTAAWKVHKSLKKGYIPAGTKSKDGDLDAITWDPEPE